MHAHTDATLTHAPERSIQDQTAEGTFNRISKHTSVVIRPPVIPRHPEIHVPFPDPGDILKSHFLLVCSLP